MREFRKRHKLTQKKLARLLHMSEIGVRVSEKRGTIPKPMRLLLVVLTPTLDKLGFEKTKNLLDSAIIEQKSSVTRRKLR